MIGWRIERRAGRRTPSADSPQDEPRHIDVEAMPRSD